MKKHVYQGETFEISKPTKCQMKVEGMGGTGTIHLDEKTGRYQGTALGKNVGSYDDLSTSLHYVCVEIYAEKRKRPSVDVLCKQMDEFYDKLPS